MLTTFISINSEMNGGLLNQVTIRSATSVRSQTDVIIRIIYVKMAALVTLIMVMYTTVLVSLDLLEQTVKQTLMIASHTPVITARVETE